MTTRRHLLTAAAGFLLGALPFVIYNVHRHAETFRSNAHLVPRAAPAKFLHVRSALGGYGLYGYLASEEYTIAPKHLFPSAAALLFSFATIWASIAGRGWNTPLCSLCSPFHSGGHRGPRVFVSCSQPWPGFLWPRPAMPAHPSITLCSCGPFQLFVAIVISSLRWKWAAISICLLLVVLNLLTIAQYISQFERNGAEGVYSDAIYPLSSALSEVPGQTIYMLDWGIQNPLEVFHNGRLHMRSGHDPFMSDTPSDWDKGAALRMFADPGALFITHTEKREAFTGVHSVSIKPPLPPGATRTPSVRSPIPTAGLFLRFSNWPANRPG